MQQLSGAENAFLGGCAGVIEITLLQPILYWKNAVQQRLPFTLDPRLLYRGLTASVTNMAVLTSLQFISTGKIAAFITKGDTSRKLKPAEQISAAFLGGAFSGVACGPIELVMIQQQRHGGNLLRTPFRIVSTFGPLAVFRGLTTSIGREALFTMGYLGIAPVLNEHMRERFPSVNSVVLQFLCACTAAFPAAFISHPLDTIKTCMQGDIERVLYSTFMASWSQVYTQGGARRFYNGFGFRYGRMCLAVLILNKSKDLLAPIFYPHHFEQQLLNPQL